MKITLRILIIVNLILFYRNGYAQCAAGSTAQNPIDFSSAYSSNWLNSKYSKFATKIDSIVWVLSSKYQLKPKVLYLDGVNNAFANPSDRNMYVGTAILDDFMLRKNGLIEFSFVVAHEFAHLLQFDRRDKKGLEFFWQVSSLSMKPIELQADFLASYLLVHNKILDTSNCKSLYKTANSLGDYGFNRQDHHGTRLQRYKAVEDAQYFSTLSYLDDVFTASSSYILPSVTFNKSVPRILGNIVIQNLPTIYLTSDSELVTSKGTNYNQVGTSKGDNSTIGVFYLDLQGFIGETLTVKNQDVFNAAGVNVGKFNFTGGIVPK